VIAHVLLSLALASTPGPRDAAQQLFRQGLEAFEKGRHDAAVKDFGAAYELLPLPEFLFNIALAYRMDGKCRQARLAYQRYLEVRPNAPNRAKVEQRIEQMQSCDAEPAAEPEAIARPAPDAVPPPLVVEVPVERPLGVRRPIAWGLLGAGLAAGALGAGFLVVSNSEYAALSRQCAPYCPTSAVTEPRGREQLGGALVVSGAVALVAGGVLWMLDRLFRPPLAVVATLGGVGVSW
jgi:tetratricopeptide (TPR) repeat protein